MRRTLAPIGLIVLVAALVAGCTHEEGKPAAQATAKPAAQAAATPPPAQAAAPGAAPIEELYLDVEANPDEGAPPLTVHFTTSVEDATPPLTYSWDFGDGSPPSTEAAPTHVYQKDGEYTATVSVKDSKGKSGSEETDIFVETE